jgi:hypothetical protein
MEANNGRAARMSTSPSRSSQRRGNEPDDRWYDLDFNLIDGSCITTYTRSCTNSRSFGLPRRHPRSPPLFPFATMPVH